MIKEILLKKHLKSQNGGPYGDSFDEFLKSFCKNYKGDLENLYKTIIAIYNNSTDIIYSNNKTKINIYKDSDSCVNISIWTIDKELITKQEGSIEFELPISIQDKYSLYGDSFQGTNFIKCNCVGGFWHHFMILSNREEGDDIVYCKMFFNLTDLDWLPNGLMMDSIMIENK